MAVTTLSQVFKSSVWKLQQIFVAKLILQSILYIVDLYWSKGGEIFDHFFLNFMSCFFWLKILNEKNIENFSTHFRIFTVYKGWATLKKCRLKYFHYPLHTVNRTDKNIFWLGQRFHNKSRSALILKK